LRAGVGAGTPGLAAGRGLLPVVCGESAAARGDRNGKPLAGGTSVTGLGIGSGVRSANLPER